MSSPEAQKWPSADADSTKKSPLMKAGEVHFLARKQRRQNYYAALQHMRQINIDDVRCVFYKHYL